MTEKTESKVINTVKYCKPPMWRLYTNLPRCVLWMLDKIEEKTLFLYFTLQPEWKGYVPTSAA